MTMPNFLIIGAAKAGTSSLHYYLNQHPEIYMTPNKQTYFFASEGETKEFKGPGDKEHAEQKQITCIEDYQALFAGVNSEKAIGESCSVYLYDARCPVCIQRYIPDAKLIIVLRDPSERAYSSYMQLRRDGYETVEDFREALKLEESRIKKNWRHLWHYKARGFYCEQIERYLALFDPAQIKIYLFDDLKRNPQKFVKRILQDLEVNEFYTIDTSKKYNATGIPKSRVLYRLLNKRNVLKSIGKHFIPRSIRATIKEKIATHPAMLTRPSIPFEIRQELIMQYREDILKLQKLIGQDLSHWLR